MVKAKTYVFSKGRGFEEEEEDLFLAADQGVAL